MRKIMFLLLFPVSCIGQPILINLNNGSTGQALIKNSNAVADYSWTTLTKAMVGLPDISGTWADSSRTNIYNAINGKLAINGNGSSLTGITTSQITASANKNFVTDAQATVIGNTSNTNSGDNAANTTYANDYRAANFVAGTNYLAPNGSAAALTNNTGGWTTLRVSGSNATTTGQTLVDITGLVSGTLSNATMYEIEAVLSVTTSNVTTGITYGISAGGTGGAAVVNAVVTGTTTAVAATSTTINTASTKTAAFVTASGISGTIVIRGFVTTRGSGTATIGLLQSKETSGTATVLIGSVLRIRLAQ